MCYFLTLSVNLACIPCTYCPFLLFYWMPYAVLYRKIHLLIFLVIQIILFHNKQRNDLVCR